MSIEQGASPVHGNENKNISVLNTDEKTHLIINAVDEGTVSVLGDLVSVLWHRKWSYGCAVQVYDVTSCMIACLQTHNGLQWFSLNSESRWNKVSCKHESLCLIVCFVWLCTWLCTLHLRWIERESSVVVYSGPRCDKISCVGGGGNLRVRVSHACEGLWCGSKADFRCSADAQKWSVPPDSCAGSSCHAFVSEVSATTNSFLNGKPAQMLQDTVQY